MATRKIIMGAIAGSVLATGASAGVSTSGDIDVLTEAADFRGNRTESSDIRIYQEQADFLLPASVSTDMNGSMESDSGLSAGTKVESFFFHFDPLGRDRTVATGSVTFADQIIGIMINGETIFLGDPILANGAILPNTGAASRGLEANGDTLSVGDDGRTLNVTLTSSASFDQFRVLTAAPVPTPGAMALLGLGGLAAARRRR